MVKKPTTKAAQKKAKKAEDPLVTRHDIIAEIVEKYPGADEVLMDFGVGCFSCYVAEFETLEQGILGHGFTEEDLEMVLKDLNEIAKVVKSRKSPSESSGLKEVESKK